LPLKQRINWDWNGCCGFITPDPPHKRGLPITPLLIRLELVKAAIEGDPLFELSGVEIDRPGPHYAVDTLLILHDLYPEDALIYLIGGDSLRDLPTWHQPLRFLEACDGLGVMRRPGDAVDLSHLEATLPGLKRKVMFVDAPLLEISSSQIVSEWQEVRRTVTISHPESMSW